MKIHSLLASAAAALILASCSDDAPISIVEPEHEMQDVPELGNPSEYHEKLRTVPYPRSTNELFINPAPLIVPQGMKKSSYLQFALSSSPDFEESATELSGLVAWNMWNCHHKLQPGTWYWRFRNVSSSGAEGEWSDTYDFKVTGSEPVFVTPTWEQFLSMAPQFSPRLYCFLDAKLEAARKNAPNHPEYASLLDRANRALKVDYASSLQNLYAKHDDLYAHVENLYQAYLITRNDEYTSKLISLLEAMIASPCSESVLYRDNFITSTVTFAHAAVYDLLADRLSSSVRKAAEDFVSYQCRRFYVTSRGYEENHIFDNHFWQINYRLMFFAALTLYDRQEYPYPLTLLEYLYELWTARAPASGFNRDGVWHNGTGYFTTNAKTLAYMPLMLSYITCTDFTKHPWYQNAGQALAYTMPPSGANVGFGDGQEKFLAPNRQVAAFTDFLARETGDAYASWYASTRSDLVHDDWEMRIYRMCNEDNYKIDLPADAPLLTWYKDAGEVAIHSALGDTEDDMAIGFRSSQFGSGSHTTSSQNAFNLIFGGKTVFRSSGYYQSFSDAYNLMWYRHSRGHNTILVNGIGQPYDTSAYGRILRAVSNSSIAYALGDASNAYCGFTKDEMWLTNFKNAGVEQTPENGFGPTPLTRYYRHLAMLQPGIMVIYDELEASEAARWDWLLHSPVTFDIDTEAGTLTTTNAAERIHCRVTLLTSANADLSQTSKFLVPPATQNASYPDQWHFTARIDSKPKVRILAIFQPLNSSDEFSEVTGGNGDWTIDDWTITASLNPEEAPLLHIVNKRTGAMLDMSNAASVTDGKGTTYYRLYNRSTMIVEGQKATELTDEEPISSRTSR